MTESAYEKRIRDYSIELLKERLIKMDEVERESESFLYLLQTLPQEESAASFEIKANDGKMEAFSIKNLPDFAVDILRLERATRTDCTAVERSILFKPTKGHCVLKYANSTGNHEKILSCSQSHEIDKNTQFTLQTNGVGCDLILLLGEG